MRRVALATLAALASAGCTSALAQGARGAPYADFLIGSYAERARDPVSAAERFAAALRAAPHDPRLIEGAAEAALLSGDVARAAQLGAEAGTATPAPSRLAMAALALKDGRVGKAQRLATGIEGAPVEQLAARLLEVWSHAGARRSTVALAALGDIDGPPNSPWTALQYDERAMVLDLAGQSDTALEAYTHGANGSLRIAQIVLLHGELLERRGRKDDARALYAAMAAGVDNPGIRAALARLDRGEPPPTTLTAARGAAVSLFAVAVLVGQQDPANQEQLAPLALAMALDPGFEGARIAFADAMRALKRGALARQHLAEIGPQSPYYEVAQAQIALSLRDDGHADEAIATLKAVIDTTGGRTSRRTLADLYRGLQRYDAAEPIYEQLASELQHPTQRDWRLFFAQGVTLDKLGRWPEAEAALQKALEVSPDQPEVLNYLGYQWVDSGRRVRDGLALLERAVAQRPDEGYIIDSLGWARYRLGEYDKAVDLLERAVELSPGDVELNDHLGDAYWREGRRIEARFQWRRVLSLSPDATAKAAAERKLAQGLPAAPQP